MFQLHSTPPPRRSGVILLIVVVMLGLFLVVGVSFMLYAESEASASRIYREAFTVNFDRADLPPDQLLQWCSGNLSTMSMTSATASTRRCAATRSRETCTAGTTRPRRHTPITPSIRSRTITSIHLMASARSTTRISTRGYSRRIRIGAAQPHLLPELCESDFELHPRSGARRRAADQRQSAQYAILAADLSLFRRVERTLHVPRSQQRVLGRAQSQ